MSCLVWLPWWLWHGAMDRFEGTLFRVNVDWLDFWLDNFNSVIRLSRVQPLAAVFSAFWWDPAASAVLVNPWNLHLFMNGITRNYQNYRFSSLLKLCSTTQHMDVSGRYMPSRFGDLFLLMVFWWGPTFCAPNSSELEQLFTAHVAWSTTVPFEGITHDLLGLNWIPYN